MIVVIGVTGTMIGFFLSAMIADLRTKDSDLTDKDWKLIRKTI